MKLKKKAKRILFILLILIIIASGIFIYFAFFNKKAKSPTTQTEVVETVDNYGYSIRNNATSLYKELFGDLKKVLSSETLDEESYAKLVAELFITDFYTLSNKVTNSDIGGIQYVLESISDNLILKAKDTLYKYVQSDLYGDRKQVLPLVKTIDVVSVKTDSYTLNDVTDNNAFVVELNWTYENGEGYDMSKTVTLIHNDNKLVVVEIA